MKALRIFSDQKEMEEAFHKHLTHAKLAAVMRSQRPVNVEYMNSPRFVFRWLWMPQLPLRLPLMKDTTAESLFEAYSRIVTYLENILRGPNPFSDDEGKHWFAMNHEKLRRQELAQTIRWCRRRIDKSGNHGSKRATVREAVMQYITASGHFTYENENAMLRGSYNHRSRDTNDPLI